MKALESANSHSFSSSAKAGVRDLVLPWVVAMSLQVVAMSELRI